MINDKICPKHYNYPPALALTIFSYLAGNTASFIVTTLLVLAIIFIFYLAARLLRL